MAPMSMPRPKRASGSRRADSESSLRSASGELVLPKWKDAVGGKADDAFTTYAPSGQLREGAFIAHAKFGKGLVVEVDGSKASILFEDGVKKLVYGLV